jgi:flagellar assembly protein FliH
VPSEPRGEPTSASPFDAGVRLEDVREEGRRLGIEEGRRAAEKEVKEALARVAAVVSELERAIARNRREAEERIAVLASAIAGHLVEREIRTSPEVIADVVRRAVAMFPVVDSLTVHLNPADLAILAASDPETPGRSQLTSGQAVRWIADPTLLPGGCFVESAERVVDARLSRTLERICRALIDD